MPDGGEGFGARWRTRRQRRQALDRIESEGISRQLRHLLALSTGARAVPSAEALQPGERALYVIAEAAVFETRREPGYWAAGTRGVAHPVGSVRLDVGRFGGLYVPVQETPMFLDRGRATITDRRVIFSGSWVRREWDFGAVAGLTHFVNRPWTVIETTAGDSAFGFSYDDEPVETLRHVLTLAGALHDGEAAQARAQLQRQLDRLSARAERQRSPRGGAGRAGR